MQRLQAFDGQYVRFPDQFEPVSCFIKLLKSTFYFADEIGIRSSTAGFPVMRANRSSRLEDLVPKTWASFRRGSAE